MLSSLYRYNTRFLQIFTDNFTPQATIASGGYKPRKGIMPYIPEIKIEKELKVWDPVKLDCFNRLVGLCRDHDVKLYFAYSPSYGDCDATSKNLVDSFCASNGIPLVDNYNNKTICLKKDYFDDSVHLNDSGASEYTRQFVNSLHLLLNKK